MQCLRGWLSVLAVLLCASPAMAQCSMQQLIPSDAAAGDAFGSAVAIDGDVAVVGVRLDDGAAGADQGSVRVYRWASSGWASPVTLVPTDAAAGDQFGSSVAVHGRWIVVGAPGDDEPLSGQGSVYVFEYTGSWVQRAKLLCSTPAVSQAFGTSVAIHDGRIVVGCPEQTVAGHVAQGAAHVFRYSAGTWVLEQVLTALDGAGSDTFGEAVDIGRNFIVVGSDGSDPGGLSTAGAAYIFKRTGNTWVQHTKLVDATGAASDLFGDAVALHENGNWTGSTRIAVGAYSDDDAAGTAQGSVSVFLYDPGTDQWALEDKVLAPDAHAGDNFGLHVDLIRDAMLVAAPGRDGAAGASQGGVYLYTLSSSLGTLPRALLVPPFTLAADGVASSVAISRNGLIALGVESDDGAAGSGQGSVWMGDLNNLLVETGSFTDPASLVDRTSNTGGFGNAAAIAGETQVFVAGSLYDMPGGAANSGAVVRFFRTSWGLGRPELIPCPVPAANAVFGTSVAATTAYVAIGATGQNTVYVFPNTSTPLAGAATIAGAAGTSFGGAVALDGTTLVIGAVQDDAGRGRVHVYINSGGTWTLQQSISGPDGASNANFGASVGLSGDTLVVGDDQIADGATTQEGKAYVFTRSGTVWSLQAPIAFPGANFTNSRFGRSVDVSGDTAVIDADASAAAWRADVYTRSGAVWSLATTLGPGAFSETDARVALSGDVLAIGSRSGSTSYFTRTLRRYDGVWLGVTDRQSITGTVAVSPAVAAAPGCAVHAVRQSAPSTSQIQFRTFYDCAARIENMTRDIAYTSMSTATSEALAGEVIACSTSVLTDLGGLPDRDLTIQGYGPLRDNRSGFIMTLGDGGEYTQSGGRPIYTSVFGTFEPGTLDRVASDADYFGISATLRLNAGSAFAGSATTALVDPEIHGNVIVSAGSLFVYDNDEIINHGKFQTRGVAQVQPSLSVTLSFRNALDGTLTGYGDITGGVANEGAMTAEADLRLDGILDNSGTITIQGGTLTVTGAVTNSGTIIGSCPSCRSVFPGLLGAGDLVLGQGSSLLLGSGSRVTCGADFDAAINDSARYDMAAATLEMFSTGQPQTLEAMSRDIGADPLALERTHPGHFPIGTLVINGLGPTTIADNRDNDGLGQASCEAVYASTLIVAAHSTLMNPTCRVYYGTLVLDGAVSNHGNLIEIPPPCPADADGNGVIEPADIAVFVNTWFTSLQNGTLAGDFDGNGHIEPADIAQFVNAWFAALTGGC